jgi:hypothetical protein
MQSPKETPEIDVRNRWLGAKNLLRRNPKLLEQLNSFDQDAAFMSGLTQSLQDVSFSLEKWRAVPKSAIAFIDKNPQLSRIAFMIQGEPAEVKWDFWRKLLCNEDPIDLGRDAEKRSHAIANMDRAQMIELLKIDVPAEKQAMIEQHILSLRSLLYRKADERQDESYWQQMGRVMEAISHVANAGLTSESGHRERFIESVMKIGPDGRIQP